MDMSKNNPKDLVKRVYGEIASSRRENCCNVLCVVKKIRKVIAKIIGYSKEDLQSVPKKANLSLSCGNPTASSGIKEGDILLDLGWGAGFDCFLAADKVGKNGKVIGIDVTPEMIERARNNAKKNRVKNVEVRRGEIENLPVEDNSIDVIPSNCVINLSTDKPRVFKKIYRILKSGGRIAISDIGLLKELPEKISQSMAAYVGCVGGAILVDEYQKIVCESGLRDIKITARGASSYISPDTKDPIARAILNGLENGEFLKDYVVSIYVEGYK
jgi:SAM-dependent methyltransferase